MFPVFPVSRSSLFPVRWAPEDPGSTSGAGGSGGDTSLWVWVQDQDLTQLRPPGPGWLLRQSAGSHWSVCVQGLLRQLVLLPGSDATPRLCPTSDPSVAELSVPQFLKSTPLQPDHQGPVYPYGEETEVQLKSDPDRLFLLIRKRNQYNKYRILFFSLIVYVNFSDCS